LPRPSQIELWFGVGLSLRAGGLRCGIRWELTFGDLESDATQSHIHFENSTNSGPVVVFLCTNLGNSPVPVQACPAGVGRLAARSRPRTSSA